MEKIYQIVINNNPLSNLIFKNLTDAEEMIEKLKDAYPKSEITYHCLNLYENEKDIKHTYSYKQIINRAKKQMLNREYEILLKNTNSGEYENVKLSVKSILEYAYLIKSNPFVNINIKIDNNNYEITKNDYIKLIQIKTEYSIKYDEYQKDIMYFNDVEFEK